MTEALAETPRLPTALPATPYVGLVPYSEADAEFFFGRDAEKRIVTANLRGSRLTLVYGPSGVGKTSLLQAGVVHDLRERVARNAVSGPERAPFATAVFRGWRDEPLPGLMEEIRLSVVEAAGGGELDSWRPGEDPVTRLRSWTDRARTLLVVLDQFEDYFLYHPNERGAGTFDAEFPRIVNEPNLRVNFLVSIREDAWAKLDRFEGRVPQLFGNYVRIEHLDRAGAREAIERPIAEFNRHLPAGEAEYTVEPALVDAVIGAAAATETGLAEGGNGAMPAGDKIETPFLQLVMERLWRATTEAGGRDLTLATLVQLGGARRIVEKHLVDALGALDPREQEIAADAFRYLVTSSRRRVVQAASDLSEWLGIPETELVPVLEKLSSGESGRILRPVPPPPGRESEGRRYEIFHDVLGEPILEWRREFERAREQEAEARRQRALRRRLALIVAGLLVLVLAFAAFAGWALHERGVAADRADTAESQSLAAQSIRAASLDPKRSLLLAAQAEAKSSTPQADEALRRALLGSPRPTVLVPHGRTVYGVDFSPDGRFVATAGKGGARVMSVTGGLVKTLVAPMLATSVRFSRTGKFVVAATADGRVRVWRVAGWRELPSDARVRGDRSARAAFSGDGRFLVAGGYPGWPTNRVWRFADGRVGRELTKRDDVGGWIEPDGSARVVNAQMAGSAARVVRSAPYTFASGRQGKILVAAVRSDSGDQDATVVFSTRTGKTLATLPHSLSVALSPDGTRVSLRGYSNDVIWDINTELLEPHAMLAGLTTGTSATPASPGTSFSPDGRLAVSAVERQNTARVWDSGNGATLADLPPIPPRFRESVTLDDPYRLRPPGKAISGTGGGASAVVDRAFVLEPTARFSFFGDLVATWGRTEGGAQLWKPFGTRLVGRLRANSHGGKASLLLPTVLSSDGRLVATADRSGQIELWSTRDGKRRAHLRGSTRFVSRIAFSPDGELVAAASFDRAVRIWRAADGHLVHTLHGHKGRVGDVAFSPDGKLLASASEDRTVRIWRVDDGELVRPLHARGPVTSVSFSGDGASLVTAEGRGTTEVWSTGSWKPKALLGPTRSNELVLQASFSHDGRYVATLDLEGTARIWHDNGGRPIRTLKNVASVVFSTRVDQVLVGGGDATASVLPAGGGPKVALLRGHRHAVNDATFSPQGDLVVTASQGGSVRVWQAATNGTVATVTPLRANEVLEAMLAADGRLVIVSADGVRLYSCEPCLRPAQLLALARKRLASRRR
jgi:WD40 repeat protein